MCLDLTRSAQKVVVWWRIFFARGRILRGVFILQGSLRLVRVGVLIFVDLLLDFPERGECYYFLRSVFLMDPRRTLRGTTLLS